MHYICSETFFFMHKLHKIMRLLVDHPCFKSKLLYFQAAAGAVRQTSKSQKSCGHEQLGDNRAARGHVTFGAQRGEEWLRRLQAIVGNDIAVGKEDTNTSSAAEFCSAHRLLKSFAAPLPLSVSNIRYLSDA